MEINLIEILIDAIFGEEDREYTRDGIGKVFLMLALFYEVKSVFPLFLHTLPPVSSPFLS
jgi:hypothetical protein